MVTRRIQKFLKKHHVDYEVIPHPPTYTAAETAQVEHVSGKEVAKVVMLKAGEQDVMVVIPSNRSVDLLKVEWALGTKNIHVESEPDFDELFPDCEVGAMPPFGALYHIPCLVDENLKEGDSVVFEAGSHCESVRISVKDFLRIAKAEFGDFSTLGKKIHTY